MEHLKRATLPANIRLGWKGLPGTNAQAYYEKSELTAVKSFITLATDHNGQSMVRPEVRRASPHRGPHRGRLDSGSMPYYPRYG
jgi:hypothetical protein